MKGITEYIHPGHPKRVLAFYGGGSMFTGLIQQLGRVAGAPTNSPDGSRRIVIDPCGWGYQPDPGASVAVNGCCLTVCEGPAGFLHFDVIQQSLDVTTLGDLEAGDAVNLEHAATPATLLGGHIVQGHVDAIGTVAAMQRSSSEVRCRIDYDGKFAPLLVSKGSVAVDGVSLTVAELDANWFEVALIPTTLDETTFGQYEDGRLVNLEFDVFAKMVQRHLSVRAT